MNLQPIRGTKDLFDAEYLLHEYIIDTARQLSLNYNFIPLSTPILEFTEVFIKTLGEVSDIVTKEIYHFLDKGGESICLRPEFTAAICRFIISNGLTQSLPLKLFSFGPLFRYERPQKGRQRQFHQINFEAFGYASYKIDAELMSLTKLLLDKLNIKAVLNINSLGDQASRLSYREALVKFLQKYSNDLSPESQIRLEKNPLRILDSKDPKDTKLIKDAPNLQEFYTDQSAEFFMKLLQELDSLDIKYTIAPQLVRGLDYYNDTVFEWTSDELGAQPTVLGGGRYNRLLETMGGPNIPAFGFAGGIERLALLTKHAPSPVFTISIIAIGGEAEAYCSKLAYQLRKANFNIHMDYDTPIKKAIKRVDKLNIPMAIIVGDEELSNHIVKIKNLQLGEEVVVSEDNLIDYLNNISQNFR